MKTALLFLTTAVLALVLSCSKSKTDSQGCTGGVTDFQFGEPFTLCYGTTAHAPDDNVALAIKFDEVYGDSRCAMSPDIQCVWEGRVDIGLKLSFGQNTKIDTLSKGGLGANNAKDSTSFLDFKIKLLSVEPYPNSTNPIPVEDYKVKLIVNQ